MRRARAGVCCASWRLHARVRMANARFDGQKLIAYAHRPEDVSGRCCRISRTNERANDRASGGVLVGITIGIARPETAFNVYIRVARELL